MEQLNGVGGASGVSGAGTSASQPSTAEREEFFSGTAAYPPEDAAQSQTKLSSARAESDILSAAEQSGGGGGECPLPAPAPDARITIREAAADTGARLPAHLVIELMFAARAMALHYEVSVHDPAGSFCVECLRRSTPGTIEHAADCRTGRVLHVLGELEAAAAASASEPAPPAPETVDAAENFFEPWGMDVDYAGSVTDSRGIEVYDCAGATEVHDDELDRYARRVRACVNFCAGVPTQRLEDAALLASLEEKIAWHKGGAR